MSFVIQHKSGLKANLPASAPLGEFYFCTDTSEVFVGTGTGMSQVNAADAKSVNGVPILGTPTLGKIPIGQGNGTAVFADPFCQGVQAAGSLASTLNPILIAGSDGTDMRNLATDAAGQLKVLLENALPAGANAIGSVSVSNFPATQAISAVALPLPAGASTAAKQPALGTAGVASADVLTVQGIASMTPLKVDGSAVTQPVSGTLAVSNFPATQTVAGTVAVSNFPATQAVAGTVSINAIPAGSAVIGGIELVDGAGTNKASISLAGALKVDGSAVTQPVNGTVTSNQGTAAAVANAWPVKISDGTNTVTVASLTNSKALAVEIVDGVGNQITSFGGGTQFADGATSATPTGTVSLGKNPSNVLHALSLDGSGNLNVNVVAGGTGGNASVSATAAAVPASATMVGGSDGTNLRPLSVSSTGVLKVDGSAVTQPVSAASLPLPAGAATSAKQPALGTAGTPATDVLTVQGAASMTALKVDGSAVTQPVSAASLPLPTGAATAAKQPALGTAGTPASDVITVQGATSMTALKVDGSAVTQPVSGTTTANQGTPAVVANAWPVKIGDGTNSVTVAALTNSKALAVEIVDGTGNQITSFGGGTQIADGTTNSTPTGTVAMGKNPSNVIHALALDSSGNLNVNVVAGGTGGNASVSATGSAVPSSATMVGGSDGTNLRALSVDASGNLNVSQAEVTGAISIATSTGTSALSVAGRPSFAAVISSLGTGGQIFLEGSIDGSSWIAFDVWDEANEKWLTGAITTTGSYWFEAVGAITQIRARASALTSGTITGTLLASYQPAYHNENLGANGVIMTPVVAAVGGSDGANLRALSTDATGKLNVHDTPSTTGGLSTFSSSIGATATSVKSSAGQVYGYHIGNSNASAVYVQLFDAAVGSVTLGSTTPKLSLFIPAGGGATILIDKGLAFATAITVACTTTRTGNTAPASTVDLNFYFA